jgi:large subunit ribosomal protein L22
MSRKLTVNSKNNHKNYVYKEGKDTGVSVGRAISKYVRVSPSKIRRVLSLIRGRNYLDALSILAFLPYSACLPIIKVIRSAASNARISKDIQFTSLRLSSIFVNRGLAMKRMRPAARGRGWQFLRLTSHIHVVLTCDS